VERVETFLPFLRENIDHINIGKSIERSRKYQEAVNQKYIMRADPILGIAALPNRTPMRNVFLTGGMLLASLGFEGEIVSGINAINLLIAKKERNDD
jgi:phytoene dehydrogenase-like protein